MDIMHAQSDILKEIEIVKEELETVNSSIEFWYFGGGGDFKYGANASINQVDKLINTRNRLFDRLEWLIRAKERTEKLMEHLEGEEYKIAYMRIVKGMTHKEIARELGYEEQTIRKKWMDLKNQHIVNIQS